MRKRLLIAAVVLGLDVILTVGASLAFFADKEEAYNVVTMGSIDIKLNEEAPTPGADEVWKVVQRTEGGTIIGLEYTNILPGATLEKKAEISNARTNPAYIRKKIIVTVTGHGGGELSAGGPEFWRGDYSGNQTEVFTWGNMEDVDASAREENIIDGETVADCITIYGDKILESTESVYLFSHIRVPVPWGNAYVGASIEIQLTAGAIQSDFIGVPETVEHASDRAWNAFLNF